MPLIRGPYDDPVYQPLEFVDPETGEEIDPSPVKQSFKEMTDVNVIIRRYDSTGLITHLNTAIARYGDYSTVNEYRENLEHVMAAQAAFDELPSDIRKRFGNDPGEFFEFASNPANGEELVRLGLAEPRAVAPNPVPTPAPAVTDPAVPAKPG